MSTEIWCLAIAFSATVIEHEEQAFKQESMMKKDRTTKCLSLLINPPIDAKPFQIMDRITHPLGIFIVTVDVAAKRNEIACWIRFAGKCSYSLSLWSTNTANKHAPNGKNLRFDDDAVFFNRKPSLGVTRSF